MSNRILQINRALTKIREVQIEFMPNRVVIQRSQHIGGGEFSPRTVADDMPARLRSGSGSFRLVADRFQAITPYVITLPWYADLKPADRIIDELARTFEIRDVRGPGSFIHAVTALADLIND